jgi:GxxExxY protein
MLRIPSRLDDDLEALIHRVIGCCIEVHRQLGPGLLEIICQRAIALELEAAGIRFEREKRCAVSYRSRRLYVHCLDLVVDDRLLLELKAVERLHPVHMAQTLSSLRVSKLKVALLINFNVPVLAEGVRRVVL